MQLTVYLHGIDTIDGTYMYASFSDAARTRCIADYCRDNWIDLETPDPMPDSDDDIIDAYFNKSEIAHGMRREYLIKDLHIIKDDILLTDPCCTVIGDSLLITQTPPK